jgi:uncharacterized protein YjbI with pentapeptide repeats
MKQYTAEELKEILELHRKWVEGDASGKRANLRGADLRWADLREADLLGADLREADLRGANLHEADLRVADLCEADLHWAGLRGAKINKNNIDELLKALNITVED